MIKDILLEFLRRCNFKTYKDISISVFCNLSMYRLFSLFKTIDFALVIWFIIVLCLAWSSFSGIKMRTRLSTEIIKSKSWKIRFLAKPVLANNKRSLCLKKSIQITSTCLSYNKNPKTIRPISLHQCCSCAINASPCSGFLAISLYSHCAYIAAIFVSLFGNIKTSLLSIIERMEVGAWGRARVLGAGIWVVFWNLLDLCLYFSSTVRAWGVWVLAFLKEKLAIWGLYDWLTDGNNIFSRLD